MPVWLIALIVLFLIVVAVGIACLVRCPAGGRAVGVANPICPRLLTALRGLSPQITTSTTGRDVTETFRLLILAMFAFGAALMIWSTGAALLRAGYLVTASPKPPLALPVNFPAGWGWGLLFLELVRGIGAVIALYFVSGLLGGLFGFLFGLPRPVVAATGAERAAARTWQSSTNLTDISDWLTKIIVGVGLVTATQIWGGLLALTNAAAASLFNSRHGSPAVIPAAMIGGAIFGFMFVYLYTQLVVARLIAQADTDLSRLPDTRVMQTIADVSSFDEALVPRISRRATAFDPGVQPTPDQLAAALKFRNVKLADLTQRIDVRNWARARALLNDYRSAADAYAQLIGMPDDGSLAITPDVLSEAARVMNAAGDRANEAAAVAELALSQLSAAPSTSAEMKEAIIGDAAALRLSRRVGGGYEAALKLLNNSLQGSNALPDKSGRLHLLRALANGQKWHTLAPNDQVAGEALKQAIQADLTFAFAHGQRSDDLRPFWDRSVPRSIGRAPDDEENDLDGVLTGDEIQRLANSAAVSP